MVTDSEASPISKTPEEIGKIGRIPVRNLWLLMLYASELFRHIDRSKKISAEENPDYIPDLVAEILSKTVELRLKRNLSFGYQTRETALRRVRGRINLLHTERRHLLDRGMIACRFEELTVDTPRNRFVRSALEEIARIVNRDDLAHRCRSLGATLRRMGVAGEKPGRAEISVVDRFGRHDAGDQMMVFAAHLAFDLALPTESVGTKFLFSPSRDDQWVRKLYEKAVAGFYDVVLPREKWKVHAQRTINWLVSDRSKTPGVDKILPSMRTDIVLDSRTEGRRIVIDTKFNSVLTKGWYREESLRSSYIYQIYAYLRSQEGSGDPLAVNAEGLLLHPSLGDTVNEAVVIQGHEIRFATVDLGGPSREIRNQLLCVIEPEFPHSAENIH